MRHTQTNTSHVVFSLPYIYLCLCRLQIYYYAVMSSALKEVNKDLKLQLRMVRNKSLSPMAAIVYHIRT